MEKRLKQIEDILELSPIIRSFNWQDFTDRDQEILNCLLEADRLGTTTTEIAVKLEFKKPYSSGRTIVYRRLKRIELISSRIKGAPIVTHALKRWSLNYDFFSFDIKD